MMSEKQLYESGMLEIVKGAAITFFMAIFGYLFMFFFKLIGARYLGPADWGLFTLAWTIMSALLIFPHLGLFNAIQIYFQEYIAKKKLGLLKGFLQLSVFLSFFLSLIMSFFLFVFSKKITLFFNYPEQFAVLLKIIAFLLVVKLLSTFLRQLFMSNKEIIKFSFSRQIFESGGLFFAGLLTYLLKLDLFFMYVFILLFTFFSFVLELLMAKNLLKNYLFIKEKPSYKFKEWFAFSLPLLFTGIFTFMLTWTDNLMLGKLMDPSSLAVYSIAFSLASFTLFFYGAFIKVFSPLAAQKFFRKQKDDFLFLFKKSASWVFGLTFPVFLVFALYSKQLLKLVYGLEYVSGYWPLIILSFGMVLNVSFGFSNVIINIHKNSKFIFKLTLVLASINILLNYFFINSWGILGAALSTALVMIVRELILFLKARALSDVSLDLPYYFKFVIAGLLAVYPAASLFRLSLNPYLALLCSAFIYGGLYLLFLLLLRTFKSEDYQVFLLLEKKLGLNLVFIKKVVKKLVGQK